VAPREPEPIVSEELIRQLQRRTAAVGDDVKKLRLVRHSVARHEAAAQQRARLFRESREIRRQRVRLAFAIPFTALFLAFSLTPRGKHASPRPAAARVRPIVEVAGPGVWLVERKGGLEIYSNGLRVDNEYLTSTRPRSYVGFNRQNWRPSGYQTQPAGIVFHTTESRMAPFEPSQNDRLQYNGRSLLGFIARKHLYHFLIDRFGRVFRVVAETDYANHAGRSIWADEHSIYWSLNQSFLGVAFEAQTESTDIATPAQIDAARVLTEMLRSRYHIPAMNCVTHAQVSVNLQTMRLGYHTDWAANFPFRAVGLGDGYSTPVAALTLFGFDYDTTFLQANGGRVWPGLVMAEEQIVREAAAYGTTFDLYRRQLRHRFHAWKPDSGAASAEDASGDR